MPDAPKKPASAEPSPVSNPAMRPPYTPPMLSELSEIQKARGANDSGRGSVRQRDSRSEPSGES